MRCAYRERRYECGGYLEVEIYPVFRKAGKRSGRAKPTSEVRARLNDRNAERQLVRLLNANFTAKDLELHLTYEDGNMPADEGEARRDIKNYLRRVKRLYKRLGVELKYIYVIEGGDGKRWHFHITLLGGVDRDALEAAWGYGYANCRRLQFNENGVEGLAKYITKQFRLDSEEGRAAYERRWSCSKNLQRPEPKERDGRFSQRQVRELATVEVESREPFERLYPGYYLSRVTATENQVNGGYYMHLRLYRVGTDLAGRRRKSVR